MPSVNRVAILTAGGLAPCLSSAIGGLIERYTELYPKIEIICYVSGYKGLLLGDYILLTNVADCVKRGLVKEGEDPLKVAAEQLTKDRVDVLHTIGGDDTNTTAADLAAYLAENDYPLTVVGLPKTIDNDVYPIRQSLGAWTAAEEGAKFFENVVGEHNANPRMLIIHEVMGRNCGWLTAATAAKYRERLATLKWAEGLGLTQARKDVHAVFIPEMEVDIKAEAERLKKVMDEIDNVNIFISEGAGVDTIVKEMEAAGQAVPRDAFGHIKLDAVNPGKWFGDQFAKMLGAEKVMVQKSGYFARAAPANADDLRLIKSCTDLAVDCAIAGKPGVIGHDENDSNILKACEFPRIAGGKPFNIETAWFNEMLKNISQPKGKNIAQAGH
ncbi:Phosphofructokinase [Carpediemonas membranifera]|uniref:Phosphofructokinase n=1 Tax=Carpediemonas membranifera TaxID=201153 RepID=A0A8J6E2K3_9EUKA|nr:Phosphofructokinase [Carpediemonas membranifera]|eukprot:KAG9394793.1 Phosphofructokinase [Carpediemonas membranifera]